MPVGGTGAVPMGQPTAVRAALRRLRAIARGWLDRLCGSGADRIHLQLHRLDQIQAMEDTWRGANEVPRSAGPSGDG